MAPNSAWDKVVRDAGAARPEIRRRTVFEGDAIATRTVVTHLGTIHSGNLHPDRHSWLVTRYFKSITTSGVACSVHQVVVEDVEIEDPAAFAGPSEKEVPGG
jgi:hypothetical protein